MKALSFLLLIGALACRSTVLQFDASPPEQAIVDRIALAHPDVARLTVHAVPEGESDMRIVASTVPGRVGEHSDPEDLLAAETGDPVVMDEAHNVDYTLPVKAESGRTIAVVGVTISGASNSSREALVERARTVAEETATALRNAHSSS